MPCASGNCTSSPTCSKLLTSVKDCATRIRQAKKYEGVSHRHVLRLSTSPYKK